MKRLLVIPLLVLVAACAQFGLTPATTFSEQVYYVESTTQGLIKLVQDQTCNKYTAEGKCAVIGRPLHPARGKAYVEKLGTARLAAKASAAMPASGGTCLGQPSTPVACLELANALLLEVQKELEKAGVKTK